MSDAIPPSDPEYDQFMNTFVPYIVANAATLGVNAATVAALTTALTEWNAKYSQHRTAHTQALAATTAKETAKAGLAKQVRPVIQFMQNSPAVTEPMLRAAKLTPHDTTRTRPAVPASRPVVTVDTNQRLQHVVHWRDEFTPTRKARPKGVFAAEIWCYIGTAPPASPEQFRFVTIDRGTPYLMAHVAADAGKTAYYNLRWVNSRQETGPWSETVSATITG